MGQLAVVEDRVFQWDARAVEDSLVAAVMELDHGGVAWAPVDSRLVYLRRL